MPFTPRIFSEKTEEEIEKWGLLGLSENVIFNMLGMTGKQRVAAMKTERWVRCYNQGLAKREMELAETLRGSKDPQLIKELLKSTSLVEKKMIDDQVEFKIEAPEWLKTKMLKGKKGKRAKVNN